jgi:hypothetical protein
MVAAWMRGSAAWLRKLAAANVEISLMMAFLFVTEFCRFGVRVS